MKNLDTLKVYRGKTVEADSFNRLVDVLKELVVIPGQGITIPLQGSGGTVIAVQQEALSASTFLARIVANESDGTNRWRYMWYEVVKQAAGYSEGAWAKKTDGRKGDYSNGLFARNTIEAMNDGDGVQGNGVSIANLTGSFAIKPAPTGVIVEMIPVRLTNGDTEYWFTYENGVDGSC